jgi:hypothetical protein
MITPVTGGKALPKEVTDQIIDRVPLFIEELTKSVVESGLVTARRRGKWESPAARPSRDRITFRLRSWRRSS